MTLEQLRIFVAVAEREHLTNAALAVSLTPSAVSSAIQALENRHGVLLFNRVGRRIELTQAGRIFLHEARATLARAQAAELALAELGGLKRGSLIIQASQTIASYWLPALLVRFRKQYPAIDIQLVVGNTETVAQAVLDGSAELGFVEGEVHLPALSSRVVAHDHLIIVVSPGHPWSHGRPIPARDLADSAWVLREPGSGTRSVFEASLRQHGTDPEALTVTLELPSNEAVRAAVESGIGATAVSEMVAALHLDAGRLVRVGFDLTPRTFTMLRHKERYRTKASKAFEELISPLE